MMIWASRSEEKISPSSSSSRSHLGDADQAHRIDDALPLRDQHVHLTQLGHNLLRLVSLPRHGTRPPSAPTSHTSGRTTSRGRITGVQGLENDLRVIVPLKI